jgi:hypothetical protein
MSSPEAHNLAPAPDSGAQVPAKTEPRPPVRMGLAPQSIEEGWRLATMLAKSELVPKQFRNKPEDCIVAIQLGAEIGFAPMQALQSIAVINGRPGIWGDGLLALILASPLYQDHDEYFEVGGVRRDGLTLDDLKHDATAAVCTFWRHGKSLPVTRRFTIGQARKAGLLGKEGPWGGYPDRMLAMRARGFAARDTFADLLRGIRSGEELRDLPPVDAPPPIVHRLSERPRPIDPPREPIEIVGTVHTAQSDTLTLTTGEVIAVDHHDLVELAKFAGTDHLLRLTCELVGDALRLQTFCLVDE